MTTRQVNEAVAAYRNVQKLEWKLELAEQELSAKIGPLEVGEVQEYARMTIEIDKAVDRVRERIIERKMAVTTAMSAMASALNGAGRDVS